ncbi:MAG: hypothetical protein BWX96_03052 [Bacteroidetes bacterium ADurb.Bin145]|jgi:hypothetical protein|nr:MAG: hypothetical protein BWX96_03052 [Bacteroidetes bacterium ADurb.Bin145]
MIQLDESVDSARAEYRKTLLELVAPLVEFCIIGLAASVPLSTITSTAAAFAKL